jgi:hypothetical protein
VAADQFAERLVVEKPFLAKVFPEKIKRMLDSRYAFTGAR